MPLSSFFSNRVLDDNVRSPYLSDGVRNLLRKRLSVEKKIAELESHLSAKKDEVNFPDEQRLVFSFPAEVLETNVGSSELTGHGTADGGDDGQGPAGRVFRSKKRARRFEMEPEEGEAGAAG
jgi:hypothetical protein